MPAPMIAAPAWRVTLGDYVATVASSPTAPVVAAGSLAGDAVLVDRESGLTVAKLAEHPFGVSAAAWSPDGATLAVGGQDGIVHLYDVAGDRFATVESGSWVHGLAWSPDGRTLAIAAGRALTLVRDSHVLPRCADVASTITAVAWSVDGRRVGVAAYGGIIWYDPAALPQVEPARVHRWKGSLLSLAVSPNGRWVCAGAQDASIHLWRLWSGGDLSMSGYPAKIEHLAFRHDGRWMASACLGEITFWDFGGKGPAGTRPAAGEGHDRHIAALGWQAHGDLLATGAADGRLALWASPRKAGQHVSPLSTADGEAAVSALTWFGPASLLVGRADGTVELRQVLADS